MIAEPLSRALEETGYLVNGQPAARTVGLAGTAPPPRLPALIPDAWWRSSPVQEGVGGSWGPANLTVLFKFAERADAPVADWQRDVWNMGSAPLLWVVSPDRIDIYNGFGEPRPTGHEQVNRLRTFGHAAAELTGLNTFAGRLAMETGQFWQQTSVDRKSGVDRLLLRHLERLEKELIEAGLGHEETQGLIGRTVFAKYLLDRGIVTGSRLQDLCGCSDLPEVLDDRNATRRFFDWLRDTFNGDMFPETLDMPPEAAHLARVASFLRADNPDGQMSLFPFRFDVIPVELISSIYERFVHSSSAAGTSSPQEQGVYYTPLAAVSLVLDEVFDGLSGDETVIDLTCGSGMFLVEALRRLVQIKAEGKPPTRRMVRSALYGQVYGVDISPSAIQIAAFSLYLAALELDPDPKDPESRRFKPLVGRTLVAGDAHRIERTEVGRQVLATDGAIKKFDVVVGNPPWTYKGKVGTAARREMSPGTPKSPRGGGLDFIRRGRDFARADTRFGVLVSAAPFFARSATGLRAVQDAVKRLGGVTLFNLSEISSWLFDQANMPAIALLARHREDRAGAVEGAMELVQVRRSREGDRSRTIGIAPSDVAMLPFASWKRNQGLLKAAFLGGKHDLLLLDALWDRHRSLGEQLDTLGTKLASGLKRGNRKGDAGYLRGLPFLSTGKIGPFSIPANLPRFEEKRAERPRERDIYRAPLLVTRESMGGGGRGLPDGRLVAAVAERDIVYKDGYWGVSFAGCEPGVAHLVAGILGSAVASWYLLMTGSVFGVWKSVVGRADIAALPLPDLEAAMDTDAGARVVRHVRRIHDRPPVDQDWRTLDEAVFDLYELDEEERIVVEDGRRCATWQWAVGRDEADRAAEYEQLKQYAEAFCLSIDTWFQAAAERRFRTEVYDLGPTEPLRVVRFALEDHPPPSRIVRIPHSEVCLADLLDDIDSRLGMSVAEQLVGLRELRIHDRREVVIVKPAARRFWLRVSALDDARAVLATSFAESTA